MPQFEIVSDFGLTGDQPQAVDGLVEGNSTKGGHVSLIIWTSTRALNSIMYN